MTVSLRTFFSKNFSEAVFPQVGLPFRDQQGPSLHRSTPKPLPCRPAMVAVTESPKVLNHKIEHLGPILGTQIGGSEIKHQNEDKNSTINNVITNSRSMVYTSAGIAEVFMTPSLVAQDSKQIERISTSVKEIKGSVVGHTYFELDAKALRKPTPKKRAAVAIIPNQPESKVRVSITSQALTRQAEVIEARAHTKSEAIGLTRVQPQNSANIVRAFTKSFIKTGKENNKVIAQIEKFMWDVASILGMEDSFAPTMHTSIVLGTGEQVTGSLQPRLTGTLLQVRPEKIGRKQLVSGTMKALIMGMFDAHGANIMVTGEENKIIFFDNTCCLPNSNGVILQGYDLRSSFRSDLIILKDNQKTLQPEECDYIRAEAIRCLALMDELRKFMRENKPKDIPPGVLEMSALDAMEERLDNIKESIADPKVTTLEELTFAVLPDYKLITALTIFYEANNPEQLSCPAFIRECRKSVGLIYVDVLIDCAEKYSIDLSKIKKLVDDGVNLSQILEVIKTDWKTKRSHTENDSHKVVKYLFDKAAFDAKDLRDHREAAMHTAYTRLVRAGVSSDELEVDEVRSSLKYNPPMSVEMSKEIDFQHPPGSVRIDGVLIQDLALLCEFERLQVFIEMESEQLYADLVEKLAPHIQIVTSMLKPSSLGKPFLVCSSGVPKDLFYCYYENEKLIKKTFDWRSDPEKVYLDGKLLPEDKFHLLATSTLLQELQYQKFLDSVKVHTRVTAVLPHQLAIARPYLWENEVKGQPKMVMSSYLKSDGSIESLPINYEEWPAKIRVGEESFLTIKEFLTNKKMTLELERHGLKMQTTAVELSVPYTSFMLVNQSTTPPSWVFHYCNAKGITMRYEVDYLSSPGNLKIKNASKPEMVDVFFANDLSMLSKHTEVSNRKGNALLQTFHQQKMQISTSRPTQFFAEVKGRSEPYIWQKSLNVGDKSFQLCYCYLKPNGMVEQLKIGFEVLPFREYTVGEYLCNSSIELKSLAAMLNLAASLEPNVRNGGLVVPSLLGSTSLDMPTVYLETTTSSPSLVIYFRAEGILKRCQITEKNETEVYVDCDKCERVSFSKSELRLSFDHPSEFLFNIKRRDFLSNLWKKTELTISRTSPEEYFKKVIQNSTKEPGYLWERDNPISGQPPLLDFCYWKSREAEAKQSIKIKQCALDYVDWPKGFKIAGTPAEDILDICEYILYDK